MPRIAVLGAGVNGLGCAVRIKDKYPQAEVVLISEEFSPNTTGDGSAGLWFPFLCGNTDQNLLDRWGLETYRFLHQLWLKGLPGVCVLPLYVLNDEKLITQRPRWTERVYGFTVLSRQHLHYLNQLHNTTYRCGVQMTTLTAQPSALLSHLMSRFVRAGGRVVRARVASPHDATLRGCSAIVNCVGLAAGKLVPDAAVFPVRGQVVRVKAPWVKEVIIDEETGKYIIPNADVCVLGGTKQRGDYSTVVRPRDTTDILTGTQNIIPSLKNAEVTFEWVGLRPGRSEVRLDSETRNNQLIIHNYGHGGSGVTLFWGCAGHVVDILEKNMRKHADGVSAKL